MAAWTSITDMQIKLEQAVESLVRKIKAGDLPPNSHNLEADVRGTIVASEVKKKPFTVEYELRGHEYQFYSTVEAWNIEQAREIFRRDHPRCEIVSVNEIFQKCGEDLQTNRTNPDRVCGLCADDARNGR